MATNLFRKTRRIGKTRWQWVAHLSAMEVYGIGIGVRSLDREGFRAEWKLTFHLLGYALFLGVELTSDAIFGEVSP